MLGHDGHRAAAAADRACGGGSEQLVPDRCAGTEDDPVSVVCCCDAGQHCHRIACLRHERGVHVVVGGEGLDLGLQFLGQLEAGLVRGGARCGVAGGGGDGMGGGEGGAVGGGQAR